MKGKNIFYISQLEEIFVSENTDLFLEKFLNKHTHSNIFDQKMMILFIHKLLEAPILLMQKNMKKHWNAHIVFMIKLFIFLNVVLSGNKLL
jgi:hypothetical protein